MSYMLMKEIKPDLKRMREQYNKKLQAVMKCLSLIAKLRKRKEKLQEEMRELDLEINKKAGIL